MHQRPAASGAGQFPERIGRYQVLSRIARGGMATVYLGRFSGPRGFEQRVAVKLVHPHLRDDEQFASDLIEEAKLSVRIRHPNVVVTLDAGEDDSGVFLVMEYVEGDSLGGLLRAAAREESRLPRAIGLRILCDALEGLHAAHELRDDEGRSIGLVHRDFSPQNILVGIDGISRLADFGVAKAASRSGHTQTGAVKGKIAYMSPEQARGSALDRRCDVWAAGAVAWELCADRRLHPTNDANTLLEIVSRPAPRLLRVCEDVPRELDEIVARALAMDARQRWPTAAAFAAAIRETGVEIASQAEVAELVRRIAGPALSARRGRLAEPQADAADGTAAPVPVPRADVVGSIGRPRGRRAWPLAVAPLLVLVVAGGWMASVRGSAAPEAELGAPSATVPAPPPEPTVAPVAPSEAPAPQRLEVLRLSSDAPMARLEIAGRPVEITAGATEVEVALEGDEAGKPLQVEARSASGKRAALTLPPGARAGELRFGAAAAPARAKTRERPLARSPYENNR